MRDGARPRVRLVPSPPVRRLIVLGFADVSDAADHAAEFVAIDGVIGLEGIDEQLVEDMRLNHIHVDDIDVLPRGQGWLIVEVGARTDEEATAYAEAVHASAARLPDPPSVRIVSDQTEQERLWKVREAGLGATARVPGRRDGWPGWEDSSVPPERLGDYVRELRKLFDRYGYDASLYGHFGQGCVHCRITFDLESTPGIEQWRSFLHDAARLVTAFGGSLSGEHGDGQQRAELLPIMFGDELVEAFRAFKAIWDPHGRMNPGKIVDARPLTADLRLGAEFAPERPKTHFAFRDDDRDFTRATLRCVGIGNCRQEGHGTMCPSYMVTHEEKHSTRGRARLLFEMMEGRTLEDGWRDDSVREALDLCLSCKGCKGECPVHVDMATYKAEFLAHYYRGRLRPRTAYAIGQVMYAARLGSRRPAARQRGHAVAGCSVRSSSASAASHRNATSRVSRRCPSTSGSGPGRRERLRPAARCCSGSTPGTTTSRRRSAAPRSESSSTAGTAFESRNAGSAAAGRSTTTAS